MDGYNLRDKIYCIYTSVIANTAFTNELVSIYRKEPGGLKDFLKKNYVSCVVIRGDLEYKVNYTHNEIIEKKMIQLSSS